MIVFLLSGIAASAAEVWPDGSKMEKWFTSEPVRVSGQEARRFVITDYGVVRDSTLLQTAAIQKVIDLAAEKGGTVVIPSAYSEGFSDGSLEKMIESLKTQGK